MTSRPKHLLILFSAHILLGTVLATSPSSYLYIAAAVEFAPKSYLIGNLHNSSTSKQVAQQNMMTNINALDVLIQNASTLGAQMIVFPEAAVTGRIFCTNCVESVRAYAEDIPEVIPGATPIIPCTDNDFDDRPILKALSCLAHENYMVMVVNMIDKKGDLLFNSDIVFSDVDGSLIAKYYKQHLFGLETTIFATPSKNLNRHVTFNTSFDVEFSVFVCYDILFCDPPLEMVKRGIKNFVYSSYWENRYPHYMSVSVHQGWSWKNKVNIISSGINNKFKDENLGRFYSSGSGIYSAGTPLEYYIGGEYFIEPSGRVIVADVPVEPGEFGTVSTGWRKQLTDLISSDTPLKYHVLDPTETSLVVTFDSQIYKQLTCSIEYKFSYLASNETYTLAASIHPDKLNQSITYALCSLSKRPSNGEGPQSFGYAVYSKFQYLKLSGTFSQYPHITVMPIVLGDQLQLVDPSIFSLESDCLALQKSEQSILAANLWGKIAGGNDGYCSNPNYVSHVIGN